LWIVRAVVGRGEAAGHRAHNGGGRTIEEEGDRLGHRIEERDRPKLDFLGRQILQDIGVNELPNAGMAEKLYGFSCSALFGYSHLFGGYSGGQAEYARVPYADVGPMKVDGRPAEKDLPLPDISPPAWMAAENCPGEPRHTPAACGSASASGAPASSSSPR